MVLLKDLFEKAIYKYRVNKTGFKYVQRVTDDKYNKGFFWRYYLRLNGEELSIQRTNLNVLKDYVINSGLPWIVVDEVLAKNSLESEKKYKRGGFLKND